MDTLEKFDYLAILCDLFGMVKWPFGKVKWPPTRGSKGHFESPGSWCFFPPVTVRWGLLDFFQHFPFCLSLFSWLSFDGVNPMGFITKKQTPPFKGNIFVLFIPATCPPGNDHESPPSRHKLESMKISGWNRFGGIYMFFRSIWGKHDLPKLNRHSPWKMMVTKAYFLQGWFVVHQKSSNGKIWGWRFNADESS